MGVSQSAVFDSGAASAPPPVERRSTTLKPMETDGALSTGRQKLRQQLLSAMIEVVGEKGYAETAVADVIRVAGVARQTFYNLFENKEDCYLAAYDVAVERMGETVEVVPPQGEWPEQVLARLTALAELFDAEPALPRMIFIEFAAAGPPAQQRYRAAVTILISCLERGSDGEVARGLPQSVSRMAVGAVTALIVTEARSNSKPSISALLPDLYFSMLMPYLGAEAAAEERQRAFGPSRQT